MQIAILEMFNAKLERHETTEFEINKILNFHYAT